MTQRRLRLLAAGQLSETPKPPVKAVAQTCIKALHSAGLPCFSSCGPNLQGARAKHSQEGGQLQTAKYNSCCSYKITVLSSPLNAAAPEFASAVSETVHICSRSEKECGSVLITSMGAQRTAGRPLLAQSKRGGGLPQFFMSC